MKIYDIVEDKQITQIEKIISELSKKNSNNVKSLTESEIKDTISIFKLMCEEIVVQPSSILTSDGRPSSYRVVDTDTGQELSRHSGANAQSNAEADARTRTAASRPATPPANDTDDADRREREEARREREEARRERSLEKAKSKVKNYFRLPGMRWIMGIFRIIPGMAMLFEEYVKQQANAYKNYELGAYGQFGTPQAQTEYKRVSNLLHTSFVTEAATLAVAGMAVAGTAHRIVTAIRRVTALVGALGGPLGAAIGFIAAEGVTYGVMWLLQRNKFWEGTFSWALNNDDLMNFMDSGDLAPSSAVSAATTGTGVIDNRVSRALGRDFDYARRMDPQGQVRDQGAASAQGTGTAGQRNRNNSGAAAGSSGSGTTQDNRAGGSSSNQSQNRSTPQNRFTDLPAFAN